MESEVQFAAFQQARQFNLTRGRNAQDKQQFVSYRQTNQSHARNDNNGATPLSPMIRMRTGQKVHRQSGADKFISTDIARSN